MTAMTIRNRIAAVRTFLGDGPSDKRTTIKGRPVHFRNRGPASSMGRFGGGWERSIGVQIGSRGLSGTIIVNLWRASVRIDPRPTR